MGGKINFKKKCISSQFISASKSKDRKEEFDKLNDPTLTAKI